MHSPHKPKPTVTYASPIDYYPSEKSQRLYRQNTATSEMQSKQDKDFHLEEGYATQYAKFELYKISEDEIRDAGEYGDRVDRWQSQQYRNWKNWARFAKMSVEKGTRQVEQTKGQVLASDSIILIRGNRKRTKTQTSHHSREAEPTGKVISGDLQRIIRLSSLKSKERELINRSCFTQAVAIIPQIQDTKKQQKQPSCPLSTTYLELPKRKTSKKWGQFGKHGPNSRLLTTKANTTLQKISVNTVYLHEGRKMQAQNHVCNTMDWCNTNKTQANMRNGLKLLVQNQEEQVLQEKFKRSPLNSDLRKLTKLLKGQYLSNLQASNGQPLKIVRLKDKLK